MTQEAVNGTQPSSNVRFHSGRVAVQSPRFLVAKALLGLLAFDVLGLGRDFARMLRFVRSYRVNAHMPDGTLVQRVCEAINHAGIWYPKRVLCLQRSVVTTCLLRHCGVSAEMVICAQLMPFKAHAWTEVDQRVLNERRDVRRVYGVLERC